MQESLRCRSVLPWRQLRDKRRLINAVASFLVAFLPRIAGGADFAKGPWLQNVTTGGIVVMWEADQREAATPKVAYGRTTAYESGTVNAVYASVNGYPVYSAAISGLSPNTVYHYRATSGTTKTADATFKTAPEKGTSGFRFYVVGDRYHTADYAATTAVWTEIADIIHFDMSEYPLHHQTFVLNTGDIVDHGYPYSCWDQLWTPAQPLVAEMPFYVGLGNHEDENKAVTDSFIYGYFNFPFTTSGSTDEKWYSFDYGNIHVAALAIFDDAGYTSGPQFDWLCDNLADASNDPRIGWIFAVMHFLPWSWGPVGQGSAAQLRSYLHPVFSANRLSCAFGGHNHLYCRYAPVDGVTYVTTGAAGSGLDTGTYSNWTGAALAAAAQVQHYCVVDVEDEAVSVRALDMDGNLLDWVTFGGTPSNRPPFADAGMDIAATTATEVTLDGSASADPEGATLGYQWTQISGPHVTLSGEDTAHPSFTTALPEDYVFRLVVSDGTHLSAPDFCRTMVASGASVFTAEADTSIDNLNPDSNYGSSPTLLIDGDPGLEHAYLRFNVSGVEGEVVEARLRAYCLNAGDPLEIRLCPDTAWPENAPTWNNPLQENGPLAGYLRTSATETWYEADVADAVSGDGKVTLALLTNSSDGVILRSREGGSAPQLVVRFAADLKAKDSDGDGLSDYDEIYRDGDASYNPYDPAGNPAGTDLRFDSGDTDGDGWSDALEVGNGSSPLDPGSFPSVIRISFGPSEAALPAGSCRDAGRRYLANRQFGWE